MKKLALMLVALLALGGAVFAEIVAEFGDVAVSGSVKSQAGYDLQNSIWGISGSSSINVQVPLITGGAGASGDDDLYGEVTLSGVGLKWDETNEFVDSDYDGTDYKGSIVAKIVAGNIFVGLNAAGFNANNAKGTAKYDVNADDDQFNPAGSGSLVFGYNDGSMSFDVEFATKGGITRAAGATANEDFLGFFDGETAAADAVAADLNSDGEFVLGADASIKAGPLTLPINFVMDPEYGPEAEEYQVIVVGGAPSIAAAGATVKLPFDFVMLGKNSGFDVAPSISYALSNGSSFGLTAYYYNGLDVDLPDYAHLDEDDAVVDTIDYEVVQDKTAYAQAGITVTEVLAGGFVDGVGADLSVSLTDLTGTLGYEVKLGLDIALGDGMTLYLDPRYGSDGLFKLGGGLTLGAAATGIDNTTVTLDYSSFCTENADTEAIESDTGIVSLSVSIGF